MRLLVTLGLLAIALMAAPLKGLVRGGGVALPGATVTATSGSTVETTVTGDDGSFSFADLAPGTWTLRITMTGFTAATQTVTIPVPATGPALALDLKIGAPNSGLQALAARPAAATAASGGTNTGAAAAGNALAVNGSVNNGAASPFAQAAGFGNARPATNSLYNGDVGFTLNSSALDAQTFSLTGQNTPKPSYNNLTIMASFGGPLIIPHLTNANNAPQFFVAYEQSSINTANTTAALMPTTDERSGDLTALGGPVLMPNQISTQAKALLTYYPLPNLLSGTAFNYQIPLVTVQHQNSLQTRVNKYLGGRNQISGNFALQSTRSDAPNIFGFDDATRSLGLQVTLTAQHGFGPMLWATFGVQYSHMGTQLLPFFANKENVAAEAAIAGSDAAAADWGPPALTFSSGMAGLEDGNPEDIRNQTMAFTTSWYWNHTDHNVSFGGDFQRLEFNGVSEPDPRGAFTFNGDATGNDFEDFLEGLPDTVSLEYGDDDPHFRQPTGYAFITDDWRASDELTLNLGIRWEYQGPMTELNGDMVNLDIAPGFTAAAPVLASDPVGGVTGTAYPSTLLRPDYREIEPRLGLAWLPFPASSMVVRAGYGIYFNTSVYQSIATQMAEQAPLWQSLNVASTSAAPLTLATGLTTPPGATPDVFAVNPDFRIGYVQTWNASVQEDLPGSLVGTLSYSANKGTRGVQEFLPNTYPPGGTNACSSCPVGFIYETSNGNSTMESGSAQLQRRFVSGFAATLNYTYMHAIDDDVLGGGTGQSAALIAQNWLDLDAERGNSSFDQSNKLTLTTQYSTGSGLRGGALMGGWRGPLFRGWTVTTNLTAASGEPLTPTTDEVFSGTGYTGVRPDVTGTSVYAASGGLHLNPAAYTLPMAGGWGNAGRDSIEGPDVFSLDGGMQRSFPVSKRLTANFRLDATNVLNHVTYPSWDTVVGSAQFGLPLSANAMRAVQTTVRLNF